MHHSSKPDPEMAARLAELRKQDVIPFSEFLADAVRQEIGATGRHVDPPLTSADEGELRFVIAPVDRKVIVSFGQEVSWIGFTPDQAVEFAKGLVLAAYEIIGKAQIEVLGREDIPGEWSVHTLNGSVLGVSFERLKAGEDACLVIARMIPAEQEGGEEGKEG